MNLPRLLLRLALGRRPAIVSGELRVPGFAAPITIRRNGWGVPAIEAGGDVDAAFGLGFCHGQDRAGQLETFLRVGRGTLAEWVGRRGLAADRMSRRIGFRRSAVAQLAALAPPIRAVVEGYARGATAGQTHGLAAKPHEFALLGGHPTPWDAADVLALLKVQSFTLPSNWDAELARLRLLRSDGPAALWDLDPGAFDRSAPPTFPAGKAGGAAGAGGAGGAIDALAADLHAVLQFAPPGGGSNNWTISGSRTASGKPLLANDPHLGPGVPPPWYVAHVRTPEWAAVGATLPGTPGISIGHNGFAAWGVTAGFSDNTDLFLETLGPDGKSVRAADGTFVPCEVVCETIRVKGGREVVEEVLVTPRGPIVTALAPGVREAVSFRAVWLDPLPVDGLFSAVRATSLETFRVPLAHWPVLPLSVVYADETGTIAWQLAGQVPRRKAGNGTLPLPADAPGAGWEAECVPFDQMPRGENPASGFHATANDPPAGGPGSPFLGVDYCDPYRVTVIAEALAGRADWDVAGCLQLQRSLRSIPWEQVRPLVLGLEAADPDAREGLALLREWDGAVGIDSAAASVFELFAAEMIVRAAKAKAPNGWRVAAGESAFGPLHHNVFSDRRVGHLVRLLRERPAGWFARPWPEEVLDALAGAVRRLRREFGPGPAYWGWGHLRRLRVDHPLLGRSQLLGPAFNLGPVPVGGDPTTVSQAGTRPLDPLRFTHNIANLRLVVDLADWGASRFVLCGGQSGNPCSPHYDDLFPLWQAGEAVPLPWDRNAIIREAKATLRLLPEG